MNSSNQAPAASDGTVLIIEDEPAITDAYARWLDGKYAVRTARTGSEALEELNGDVDIVLLDRRLPDIAGEDLLSEIRSRNMDCRVAIISTVEPDFDILELGFDLYLEKPITEPETLQEAVATLINRSQFDTKMQEFLSLASKKATLEAKKSVTELSESDEYEELLERVQDLRSELRDVTVELDDEDLRVSFSHHR